MPTLIAAIAVIFIVACCVVDARTRRIPNALSASAMLAGLGLNTMYFGLNGFGLSLGVCSPPQRCCCRRSPSAGSARGT